MKMIALIGVLALVNNALAGDTLKTNCQLSWEIYPNTQVKGLIQQTEINNEDQCKTVCETTQTCWNIDFNFAENTCWFGSEHLPANRVPDNDVDHWDLSKACTEIPPPPPRPTGADCAAIHRAHPDAKSGVYEITVAGLASPVQVYCDMDTTCGGWTVFQRRKDGSVNFKQNYATYGKGFGSPDGEFWLGNDILAALTKADKHKLRIDLVYADGTQRYAEYNDFEVAGAAYKYQLSFKNCSYFGNAGNALGSDSRGDIGDHNNMKFSTFDQDNDLAETNCAVDWQSGWWYHRCYSTALNRVYGDGLLDVWNGNKVKITSTEMKMRSVVY